MIKLSLCSQEGVNVAESLEQRKRALEALVCQELAKGTPLEDIYYLLHDLRNKTSESIEYNRLYSQVSNVVSQLCECEEKQCKSIRQEYYSGRGSRDRVKQCEEQCRTIGECRDLQQELDKLRQERDENALIALENTPEDKVCKQVYPIIVKESRINVIEGEIRKKRKSLRPLKAQRDALYEEKEAMLDVLKSQVSQ